MTKIIHAADLHVGDSRNLPNYLDRQEKMLSELTRISIEEKVQIALYCGDICDAKHMLPREKDLLLRWMIENDRAAEKNDFWVLMMNGNHDEIEAGYTHLRAHKIMADYGMFRRTLVIEDKPQLVGPLAGVWFAVLPAHRYQGDEINDIVAALRSEMMKKLKDPEESPPFVAMVHEAIDGAATESGYSIRKGPKLSRGIGVTYWALGDIHKPFQQILPNAWYPGSPIQHEFGDVEQDRGVLIVDLDDPTHPKPVMVRGVTPLVTITEIPEEWPVDQIIRFEGKAQDIAETVFPDNVVGFKPVVQDIKIVVNLQGDDLLEGLEEIFKEQQIVPEIQESVIEEIRSAL